MGLSMRWLVTIPQQLLYTTFLGLVGPYSISVATGLDTLWFLPLGLTFGSWLGAWLVWPHSSRFRTLVLLGSAAGTIAGLLLLTFGIFGWVPAPEWRMALTLVPLALLPILSTDVAVVILAKRQTHA